MYTFILAQHVKRKLYPKMLARNTSYFRLGI